MCLECTHRQSPDYSFLGYPTAYSQTIVAGADGVFCDHVGVLTVTLPGHVIGFKTTCACHLSVLHLLGQQNNISGKNTPLGSKGERPHGNPVGTGAGAAGAAAPTAAIKTISVNIPFRKQNKDINVDKMIDGSKSQRKEFFN